MIPFEDPTVILPHSSLDVIKGVPEPDLTLNGNMYQRFFGRFTQIGTDDKELVDALKFDLTHNVPHMLDTMAEEVSYGFHSIVGHCKDWKSFPTYQTMLQIVALTSGRTFVGLPLSRTEEWLQASIQHTIGSVQFSDRLRGYPALLRPVVAPFLKDLKSVREVQDQVTRLLRPIIDKHVSSKNLEKQAMLANGEEGRMVSWLLGRYARNTRAQVDPNRLVRDHLTLSFAAIHVASIALTHVLHDLAFRPEYMQPLRDELSAELAKATDGKLSSKGLANLVKMDSFIKESLRLSPSGIG